LVITATELLVGTDVAPGMLVKLERVRRVLRQTDVAALASVTQVEVSAVERGQRVPWAVSERIFTVLGLRVLEGAAR